MKKILTTIQTILISSTIILMLASSTFSQENIKNEQPKNQETPTNVPNISFSTLITKSIIFIYEDNTPTNTNKLVSGNVLGTAFIIGMPIKDLPNETIPLIITAKHVIGQRKTILARYTKTTGSEPLFIKYDIEELKKNNDFWENINDEGVDIAIFRTPAYEESNIAPIPFELIASKETFSKEHIDVTDRINIPCLMTNYPGLTKNYPIFRDGSIALISEEPIPLKISNGNKVIETKQNVIFINTTVNEGFSGAPVFLWPGIRVTAFGATVGGKPWLIGIVHGFYNQPRQIVDSDGQQIIFNKTETDKSGQVNSKQVKILSMNNSGTGIIFPSWQILEIIQTENFNKRFNEIVNKVKESLEKSNK